MMGGMDGGRRLLSQETSKPQNVSVTLARFGVYFKRYWGGLLLVAVLITISTWTQVFSPQIIGQAVDCYLFSASSFGGEMADTSTCWYTDDNADAIAARINADDSIPAEDKEGAINSAKILGLGGMVLVLVALFLTGAALQGMAFYAMSWTGQNVLREMRKDLFKHMLRLPLGFYSRNETGNVMSRITSDTDTIQQVFGFALLNVVSGSLLIVWIAVEMLRANLIYGLLSLSAVPFMAIATVYFSQQARKAFRISRQEMGSVNADLQERIAGARESQAFNREEQNIDEFRATNAANRDANIRAAAFTSALTPVLEALGFVALAIVVLAGGYSLLSNAPLAGVGSVVSIGLLITFLQYVQRFNQPIQQIAVLWTNIQSGIAGGERIFKLLDQPVDIKDQPDAKAMPLIQGQVKFEDVWSEYESDKPILRGVSFEAQTGQMVAIVGPTGAGKTTLINLLPRFYDVTRGTVMIDGHDVSKVSLESLRSQIGIVLQDTFLFSDTIMNNIRYGKLNATDEEVIAAARLVAADAFIERLPNGYQTVLGERGSGLSQGQRQLIAIARAALLDPRILILDEATSSVDTRTERMIQSAFEKLLEGRTSFVIAHRLSTIRNADLLLVVADGIIVERGTHDSLIASKGAYYDLYMNQFRNQQNSENEPA